jgi:hypothetical protein
VQALHEAGEACGPAGPKKLPWKVQEVNAESWNYLYVFDMYYSKHQSLIFDFNMHSWSAQLACQSDHMQQMFSKVSIMEFLMVYETARSERGLHKMVFLKVYIKWYY